MNPRRGDVVWVNLGGPRGTGIARLRPCVVVQGGGVALDASPLVMVAPCTTGNLDRIYPHEVHVAAPEGGLTKPCKILLNQIQTLEKSRILDLAAPISPRTMQSIEKVLKIVFEIP